jgi:hypothetical protein
MDTRYLFDEIVGGLEDVCYPVGRNTHKRKSILRFDNAPILNTRTVMGQLAQSGFKRMEPPTCTPNLAPGELSFLVT